MFWSSLVWSCLEWSRLASFVEKVWIYVIWCCFTVLVRIAWSDLKWCAVVRFGLVCRVFDWFGEVRSGVAWVGAKCSGLVWFGVCLEWAGVANLAQFRQPGQIWTALEDSVMEVWSASGLERNGPDLSTEVRFEQSRTNQDRIGTNSHSCGLALC